MAVREFTDKEFVVMVTKLGVIKKCELTEFDNPMSKGIIAISLKSDEDELIAARISTGENLIFLATHDGKAIKFKESDVRAMGRQAAGVNAMDLAAGDYIIGAEVVGDEDYVLSISEKGFGKRTRVSEYRQQTRAGKGIINMNLTNKTGKVVSVMAVKPDTDVIVITQDGKILRTEAADIRKTGRSASGVRIVKMEDGDCVAAATTVQEAEVVVVEEENGQGDLPLA
jgi:DNA gyrase subunit A